MKITEAGHYIVRVKSNIGVQFAHMELPVGYETDNHEMIDSITAGPEDDAPRAWQAHHLALRLKSIET